MVASLSAREFTSFFAPAATVVFRTQVHTVEIGERPSHLHGLVRARLAARHNGESVTSTHQKPPLTDQNASLRPEAAHPPAGRARTRIPTPRARLQGGPVPRIVVRSCFSPVFQVFLFGAHHSIYYKTAHVPTMWRVSSLFASSFERPDAAEVCVVLRSIRIRWNRCVCTSRSRRAVGARRGAGHSQLQEGVREFRSGLALAPSPPRSEAALRPHAPPSRRDGPMRAPAPPSASMRQARANCRERPALYQECKKAARRWRGCVRGRVRRACSGRHRLSTSSRHRAPAAAPVRQPHAGCWCVRFNGASGGSVGSAASRPEAALVG